MSNYYNSEYLKPELELIMEDEADIIEFASLLEKIRNLGNYSVDRRQMVLSDLIFWKSQIENQRKQVEIRIKKLEALEYQKIYNKLKVISKPTNEQVRAELESTDFGEPYDTYQKMALVCQKWSDILSDLYFTSQVSHKILSKE